jgi:cephalosporin-C deacetylase-like acetyl esterase
MNPYSYTKAKLQPNLKLKQTTRKWWHYAVDFPTAYPLRYKKSNTVLGEYFQPRGANKAALVILLHGIGDSSVIPCKLLAKALAKKGIASFILYSVMHSSRMPESAKKRFPHLTAKEWFESHQISVIDLRQVIDWASRRDEINSEKIATIGISFGGFISAIAMGIDKRIKAAGLIVTGGNSSKIGWERRTSDFKEAEYHNIQSSYRHYLDEIAEKGWERVTPPRESFLTDPMTFAHLLRQRPVLMISARWEEAIPREATLDFWREAGKPTLILFPATHATIWLWYPSIRRKIVNFLKEVL